MYSKMPTKRKISIFFGFGWPSITDQLILNKTIGELSHNASVSCLVGELSCSPRESILTSCLSPLSLQTHLLYKGLKGKARNNHSMDYQTPAASTNTENITSFFRDWNAKS